jgi:exopolysaccharide biosynthesis polyprenyl glycosylphosphotransferase
VKPARDLLSRQSRRITTVLIIGASPLAAELAEMLGRHLDYELVGVVTDTTGSDSIENGLPVLGTLDDFERIVSRVDPNLIVVASADRRGSLPIRTLLERRFQGRCEVEDGVAMYERMAEAMEFTALTPASVLFSGQFQPSRWHLLSTRALGCVLSSIALVVFAPVGALIAVAIKLDSPGPVIFAQERMGAFGRPFRLFKFRTMHPVLQCTSEWVRDNDERITRVGVWLRKFRLDELPQLANILMGDMNLVGPRPHPVANSRILTMLARNLCDVSGIDIPYYALRCRVRPGITGWAQVRYGYANDFAEELEKLRYDLYYIKHLSILLDLRILLETFRVVVLGHDSSLIPNSRLRKLRPAMVPRALTRRLA